MQMSALGTRPSAVSRYHQTKWAAEEIVRNSGLAWTIFRPSLIYGPDDEFVNLFAKISRLSPIVPVLGPAKVLFQPVSVHQVARAFVASVTEPAAQRKTFDLAGPEKLTLPQVIDAILKATGRQRFKLRIPRTVSTIQAASLELLYGKLLRRPPPLNRDQLLMLGEDNTGEPGTADALFHLKHPTFQDGIREYLKPWKA